MHQLNLRIENTRTPAWTGDETIEQKFLRFHELNPHVYKHLCYMARDMSAKGHRKIGIGLLFEVLRWRHMMTNDPNSEFKLNNNYRSRYARLIASNEKDLAAVFECRQLTAD